MAEHLAAKRVAFAGKLGGANRRQARQLVREHGGQTVELTDADIDLLVLGEAELPLGDAEEQLDSHFHRAAAEGKLEIVSETEFWRRLGLVDHEASTRLYTPAMLADLLRLPVSVIRRWHRRKLIVPVHVVHQLPYFDFQEVATARQLAKLLSSGMSPATLERKLAQLARFLPDVARPLAQLSVMVEGKQLLLRQGEGLIEPGGQRRIDFDALEASNASHEASATVVQVPPRFDSTSHSETAVPTTEEMVELAEAYEENGQLQAAAEMYRAAMAASGPSPELCFHLAEILYRLGQVEAARERYYTAIELNEDYVEARANLGCVLAETGQPELAIAAFEGALLYHPDYADVHYHLARILDDLGECGQAQVHWRTFLELAPDSPWSDEARERSGRQE